MWTELWQWRICGSDKGGNNGDKIDNEIAKKFEWKNIVQCGCSHDEDNEIREAVEATTLAAALVEAKWTLEQENLE